MTDEQLIDYCDNHSRTPKALFAAWRVNRMIELAGNPRDFAPLLGHQFATMRGEMQILVNLARKRLARPATGLFVGVGRSYRDVNGDIRQVIDMPPRANTFDVVWRNADGSTAHDRLRNFQEWALEEVKA